MRTTLAAVLLLSAGVGTAAGQEPSRWYAGGTVAASRIMADEVKGTAPMAGAVIGLRLTPAFSVEADVSRGLRNVTRDYEGTFISFAARGASLEEIERQAVYRRFHTAWTPTMNLAVLAVWRSTTPSRVGAAVFAGVTAAYYHEEFSSDVIALPVVVPLPLDHPNLLPERRVHRLVRGGLTGGILVPITITGRFSLAPEIRYAYGSMGDEKHNLLRAGVRMLWGF